MRRIKDVEVPVVIVLNRSCPAVSQICNLIRFPSSSMVLILKSILKITEELVRKKKFRRCSGVKIYPIVVIKLGVNESSENRKSKQLFPTPIFTKMICYLFETIDII